MDTSASSPVPSRRHVVARRFSDIGNAITYSVALAVLFSFCLPQAIHPWAIFIITFLLMVFLPGAILFIAMKWKNVDFDFSDQKSRTPYYLAIEGCYLAGVFVFSRIVFPSWPVFCISVVSAILNGSMLAINLKWKISAHAAGSVGPATGIAIVFGWWTLLITVPITAGVLWSRLYLKKHTLAQVIAGTMLAIGCYALVFLWLYPQHLF